MNVRLVIGVMLALMVAHFLLKRFTRRSATALAYRKQLRDVLTQEKYQVKGRFE
jgi:hypothetical protein